jgi:NAD(P)-dependent dehydrogenase (short-subunit alcohol dehydrogenase family)
MTAPAPSSALAGKTALVTGITSGIGRALVAQLLAAGADVLGVARGEEKLAAVARVLGPRFTPLLADLAVPADRQRLAVELRRRGRPIDAFVSNAAECVYESPLALAPVQLRRLFEVNVLASMELCQAVVPLMKGGGQVVLISSVTARHLPSAPFAPYATTKRALESLAEALRLELHPRGVRVSVVSPGLVDTPIYDKLPGFASTKAKMAERIAVWLSADDVAQAVLWVIGRPAHVAVSELVIMPAGQAR